MENIQSSRLGYKILTNENNHDSTFYSIDEPGLANWDKDEETDSMDLQEFPTHIEK